MKMNDLISRIGYFRSRSNLSARELSLRIGKSEAYINKLESKDFTLSLPVLFDIVDVLGISLAEFFADDFANYHKDSEILNLLKKLPTDRKNSFIDLMKNTK